MDLEFATNQDLVQELMRRHSFIGVIIYNSEMRSGCKEKDKELGGRYKIVSTPNLSDCESLKIIKKATDVLNKRCPS